MDLWSLEVNGSSRSPGPGDETDGRVGLELRTGLRVNLARLSLLILQVAFVGAMVGVERTVLPLLAKSEFGLASNAAALSFILAFGAAKAPANLMAGEFADRFGRRRTLIAGWCIGAPAPLLIAVAPSWNWVIAANVLLGLQQGLCWSTSIFMKVDFSGVRRRGLAIGINEFAGYLGTASAAYATGVIAAHAAPRWAPFVLGEFLALGGLATAFFFVEDTLVFVLGEANRRSMIASSRPLALAAFAQAGFVTKFADVATWGLLPIYFSERGLSLTKISLLAAAYPAAWGILQPFTGALSDARGRRTPMVAGMLLQGIGLVAVAASDSFATWLTAVTLLGSGTALAYPVLIAATGDSVEPHRRAAAIGRFRLWRDLGFVGGAVLIGVLADQLGTPRTLETLAMVAVASGGVIALSTRRQPMSPMVS
ncbi:MAG: MFS transporter [Actinomycetota bacterium]|nr:MFS transporter [Actinomycetota bacterium]